MSVDQKKTLSRIRTFAHDLEEQRKKDNPETAASAENVIAAPAIATLKVSMPEKHEPPIVVATKPTEHIPAFHELQKKPLSHPPTPAVPAHATAPVQKVSDTKNAPLTLSMPHQAQAPIEREPIKKVFVQPKKTPQKFVGGGNIITDNKNNKQEFLPALLKSIDAWVRELFAGLKKKEAPKYTITETERRKGVIQKATSKTGSIFTADNETLKEEIRRRQQADLYKKEHTPEITWSANTDAGFALLEAHNQTPVQTANVQVEFKKRTTAPVTTIVVPKIPEPVFVAPIVTEVPKPAPVAPEEPVTPWEATPRPVAPPQEVPSTTFTEMPLAPMPQPVIIPKPTIESQPIYEAPVQTRERRQFSFPGLEDLKRLNTNALTITIVGFVSGFIIVAFVVRGLIGIIIPDSTLSQNTPEAVAIIPSAIITDVTLSPLTQTALIETIRNQTSVDLSLKEMRFVDLSGNVIPTQTLLQLFAFNTNPNFNQSVTDFHVATVGTQKALVFNVTDPTTVFGALLEWESIMARDLGALFNITPLQNNTNFVDQTIGQSDLRILMAGEEQILVYGFINKNTVVITENTNVITDILSRQQ